MRFSLSGLSAWWKLVFDLPWTNQGIPPHPESAPILHASMITISISKEHLWDSPFTHSPERAPVFLFF